MGDAALLDLTGTLVYSTDMINRQQYHQHKVVPFIDEAYN